MTANLLDTRCESSLLSLVYVLYVSDVHLPSLWITRSEISPPTARVDAPPIRSECKAKSLGLRICLLSGEQEHNEPRKHQKVREFSVGR